MGYKCFPCHLYSRVKRLDVIAGQTDDIVIPESVIKEIKQGFSLLFVVFLAAVTLGFAGITGLVSLPGDSNGKGAYCSVSDMVFAGCPNLADENCSKGLDAASGYCTTAVIDRIEGDYAILLVGGFIITAQG